ncbi:hypothetical protein [Draconibacterium halophilum]|uniref:Uncharacterized protein n=1 Tax=Draconibacterium halophilum TaxID=2706887 RepID=A0A6C0RE06_9BACT|nr:hypothetical protein [Draconibacterium halophilum]QIA08349.1 hypothetical protein G0Q07_11775 [Draconibacterium halophilum]
MKETFWKKHISIFIVFISELYPLTKFQLLQYEEILDWNRIRSNSFIRWDDNMRKIFAARLRSATEIPPRDVRIISEEDGELLPGVITLGYPEANDVYLRAEEQTNAEQIYWKDIGFGVYEVPEYNENAVMLLLTKLNCTLNLGADPFNSLPIPTKFLEERKDTLQWDLLSSYWGLKWSFELLKQFEQYWVWEELQSNHTAFNYCLKDDLDDEFIEMALG